MTNNKVILFAVWFIFAAVFFFTTSSSLIWASPVSDELKSIPNLQIPFIKNEGQIKSPPRNNRDFVATPQVKFYTRVSNGTIFICDTGELLYSIIYPRNYIGADDVLLPDGSFPQLTAYVIKERPLVESTESNIRIEGFELSQTYVNYLIDSREDWRDNIATYNLVTLGEVWKGITFNLKANQKNIEKLFIVSPNGNVDSIKFAIKGIKILSLKESGELELTLPQEKIAFTKPIAYQDINGARISIEVCYRLIDNSTYGFDAGNYDHSFPLIIDPLLASTYIGGATEDVSNGIVRDSAGNVFIVGYAAGSYPTTAGAYQTTFTGGYDVVVSKFNSTATALLASTFVGSTYKQDLGYAIAVDSSNNIFITGTTSNATTSNNSPATTGAYDTTANGSWDAFAAKLNNNLTSAGFAFTFIGGTGDNYGYGIAVNSSNYVFICGQTGTSFPAGNGGIYTTFGGGSSDGFVFRLGNNLSAAQGYVSTFLGGNSLDACYGLRINSSNNSIIVTGGTASTNFPTLAGAYALTSRGLSDVFITTFSSGLTSTLYSTLLGGSGTDVGDAVAIDQSGNIFVTGETDSSDFPNVPIGSSSYSGAGDVFIAKLSTPLSGLIASRYIGGGAEDIGRAIAMGPVAGQVFLSGYTASSNFVTFPGSFDSTLGGASDSFIVRLDNSCNIISATYIGGNSAELSTSRSSRGGIMTDSSSNVFITGATSSTDFPVTTSIYSTYAGGTSDIFLSRMTPDLRGGSVLTTSSLASPTLRSPASGATGIAVPSGLQWDSPSNPIGLVTYTVYLDTTSYPLRDIYSGSDVSVTTSSVNYQTAYYWYVVATDWSGRVSWTGVWRFTTGTFDGGTPPVDGGDSGSSGGSGRTVSNEREAFVKPLGTCFIATAVYGNPMHPNIVTLKNFRDKHLLTNTFGRYGIEWYYRVSPPIAVYLSHSPFTASIVRIALTPIVWTIKYPIPIGIVVLLLISLSLYRRKAVVPNAFGIRFTAR